MVEDINTSELVSEVTSALVVTSSKACLVIEFPGMLVYLTHLYLYPEANTAMYNDMCSSIYSFNANYIYAHNYARTHNWCKER